MPLRKAQAAWKGGLKDGEGVMDIANESCPFSAESRFGDGQGSNPEEMLGAAHAGCFSMALTHALEESGYKPEGVETGAEVDINPEGAGFKIGSIKLTTNAKVDGIEDDEFQKIAEQAKNDCPVSKALQGVNISLEAKLATSV
jgi:osmotically inducible protein OsmC